MNLASKIILGFLIVFALVFFFLAMYSLDLRNWQRLAQAREKEVNKVSAETALMRDATDSNARDKLSDATNGAAPEPQPGIKQLRRALSSEMAARGRMWLGNAVPAANTAGAPLIFTVQPNAAQPAPLTMTPSATLFVFEFPPVAGDPANNAPPGHYLGEFTVLSNPPVDPAGGKFAMAPTNAMSPREQKKLMDAIAAGMPWIAYEKLPQDRYGVLDGMTEADLETKFPGIFSDAEKTDLARTGLAAKTDDPDERKDALGNYRRPLQDYAQLLETAYRVRSSLYAKLATLNQDLSLLTAANEDVKQEILYRQDEVKLLNVELARLQAETKLVEGLLGAAETKLASVKATSARLESDNRRLVADLTAKQRKMLEASEVETATATP